MESCSSFVKSKITAIFSSERINSAPVHNKTVSVQSTLLLVLIKTQDAKSTFNFLRSFFVDDFSQPAAQDLRSKLVLALITNQSDTV